MLHEPFLGQLPCSIDWFYFARWLRDGNRLPPDAVQPPADGNQHLAVDPDCQDDQARARLLIDSAVSEFRMY